MATNPMTANQQQLAYNQEVATSFGSLNSEEQIARAKRKEQIGITRERQEASFAKSEDERWNAENPLAPKTSSLGPLITPDYKEKGPNRLGVMQDNLISNNFSNLSQVAANGVFGGDQVENSFDRPMPLAQQELPVDDVGMNSLYNNNKTV
jgi:hypothetical protein|tara:strand:+ start:117 stop:569 length:453 start_codon:yes stop_codon:yes gene_type:complete